MGVDGRWWHQMVPYPITERNRRFGRGENIQILSFTNTGELAEISSSQYADLVNYARNSEYEATVP